MVINNFNLARAGLSPDKTEAVLIIESNAVLPFTVTSQCFQVIAGRYAQLVKLRD